MSVRLPPVTEFAAGKKLRVVFRILPCHLFPSVCFFLFSILVNVFTNTKQHLEGHSNIFLYFFPYFFIFWPRWVSLLHMGSLQLQRGGTTLQLWCAGFSLWWLLLLQIMGSRNVGFSSCCTWAHSCDLWSLGCGLSCSTACGIFPDEEWNPCPLHCHTDSYLLHHQGSPEYHYFTG